MTSPDLFTRKRLFLRFSLLIAATSAALPGSSLFIGFNTQTPVQLYDTTGQYIQDVGPAGAIAGFPDTAGNYFSVAPNSSFTSSVVSGFNGSMSPTGSFTVSNLLTDGGSDAGNLLLSAFDGTVYRVSTSGTVLNSWSTGFSHVGVTSNGTDVFTTEGDTGNLIDIWSSSGASLGHIATPFVGLYGLGWDSATGDFWAGTTNFVYQLDSDGGLIATFDLVGDSRTPNGAIHDGLEVGNLAGPVVTPEPSSLFLLFGGLLLLALLRFSVLRRRILQLGVAALAAGTACFASVNVTLAPSVASGAPVGTTINWVARATDTTNSRATFTYQFSFARSGSPFQVRRDFYTFNAFPWTPSDSEGAYEAQVVVHSSTGATGIANAAYEITSRVFAGSPLVSRTLHPMVALYSLPPCTAGHTARVRFKLPSDAVWQTTSLKTCTGSTSLNFYVAGMRASTTYDLQHDVFNGPFSTPGPVLTFTTGAAAANVASPFSVTKAYPAPNNTAYPVLLLSPLGLPYATDTSGRLIWYLRNPGVTVAFTARPVDGGTILLGTWDGSVAANRLLREYDLAGNIVRETNYAAVSAQLIARGADPITTIHHDALRLPDGSTAFIASTEKVADQGAGPVDVLGDQIVVVDSNLRVKWSWSEFDHLDLMRPAVLGETCVQGNAGCPHLTNPNFHVANDWTHSNGIWLAPDGNFLISSRHQDWVMKVRYQNGSGDGALLWKLGEDGDFRVNSSDPHPWFSHQHNPEIQPNGLLSLFDNGNTRVQSFGGNSRGQAWHVDETNRIATPVVNINFGVFSTATGSAQLLSNGNYTFNLGFVGTGSSNREYTAAGTLEAEQNSSTNSYRSFRMRSLYAEH